MAGMVTGGAGDAAPGKVYYSTGRKRAAIGMLMNGGKTASAKGTSAMMAARRSNKQQSKKGASKVGGAGKMGIVMREYKNGQLHSGSDKGPKVTNRKQAIAIGLSEQKKYSS